MLRHPQSGDRYLSAVVDVLNAQLGRLEPDIVAWRDDGTNVHLRFRAPGESPFIVCHIQSSATGKGGATYSTTDYVSDTEIDCRLSRVQDVSLSHFAHGVYTIFLVPVQYDAAGTRILYDGVNAPDRMVWVTCADPAGPSGLTASDIGAGTFMGATYGFAGTVVLPGDSSLRLLFGAAGAATGAGWKYYGTAGLAARVGDDSAFAAVTVGALTTNGGLQTFGANDSAGAGYRLVRVPN